MSPEPDPPPRDLAQWLAALAIVVGLSIVLAQSIGVASINDSTLRLVLGAGIILFGGPKAIQSLADALAEYLS